MEMALLGRYAASMFRHRARGGLLVSHGDYRRPDNWGALLCCRSVASAATERLVSAWPQYSPVARTGYHREPSFAKNLHLLPLFVRAQRRVFCHNAKYYTEGGGQPENGDSLAVRNNKLKDAMGMLKDAMEKMNPSSSSRFKAQMMEGLSILEELAADEFYRNSNNARKLCKVVLPVGKDVPEHFLDDVVQASLTVTWRFLQNAPPDFRTKLCKDISQDKKVKASLERIGDRGGSAQERELANDILAKLASIPI